MIMMMMMINDDPQDKERVLPTRDLNLLEKVFKRDFIFRLKMLPVESV